MNKILLKDCWKTVCRNGFLCLGANQDHWPIEPAVMLLSIDNDTVADAETV